MNPSAAAPNPLEQLRDIHLPDAPGLWPLAPGWWLMIILCVTLIAATTLLVIRHRNKNRYRKMAHQQADQLMQELQTSDDDLSEKRYFEQAIALLKRTSLHRYPGNQMAVLSANHCLDQLNQHCKNPIFTEQICEQIAASIYRPQSSSDQFSPDQPEPLPNPDLLHFHQMMKAWIKSHR